MRPASYLSCMQCNADLTKEGKKRRRCAGCHSVFYDDVTCQKKDWAIHKTECKELQRRFIATVRSQYPEVDTMAKLLAHPDACRIISYRYSQGEDGFERNSGLSLFWTTQWMKGGDIGAVCTLGLYYTSEVAPNKYKEGVKLLLRACESIQNNTLPKDALTPAQRELGRCFRSGKGVQVNTQEAVKWFRLAAEGGHVDAQAQLGEMFVHGEGVEKDGEEAMVWFRKAAEQGHEIAQYQLGLLLLDLVPENEVYSTHEHIAVKWLRRSAEQGLAQAEHFLGICLIDGWGVAKDTTEAVVWLRKSAAQGLAEAQYTVGTCYACGNGVAMDRDEALRLFRLSADQGHDDAKDTLLKLGL